MRVCVRLEDLGLKESRPPYALHGHIPYEEGTGRKYPVSCRQHNRRSLTDRVLRKVGTYLTRPYLKVPPAMSPRGQWG